MAIVFAIVSDLHNGSTVGLCPPSVELDDGGEYKASKGQLWLWDQYQRYWEWVDKLRHKHSASLYMGFNGDITDGNHHGTTQIVSANSVSQAKIVDGCMRVPMQLNPDAVFFVRGTEAHVGKSASAEESIASGLLKDGRPVQRDMTTGTASWWNLRQELEGVRISMAHHGRIGTRPWTKPNIVMNLAAEIFYEHAKDGDPHPHIAIRSHYHRHVDTYDAHPVRVIQMPAWQFATAYVYRIAAETLADIGGIALVLDNGNLTVEKFLPKYSRGPVWTPQLLQKSA